MRHEEVNKLIKRGLDQAKFLSTLEPVGLSRKGDKKRPDGLTYPTWKKGKCLIWDFTCADTLCKSYVKKASKEVGSAAAGREDKKVEKYSNLSDYHFGPVGIETYGAYGPQGLKLVKQIGKKIQEATCEKLATFYLFQSISMAIQRGNASCITTCVKECSSGLEGLFNFQTHEAEELWWKISIYITIVRKLKYIYRFLQVLIGWMFPLHIFKYYLYLFVYIYLFIPNFFLTTL